MIATPRYLIGIDLGTTNSAVAYVDRKARLSRGLPVINRFQIPQILTEGEMTSQPILPSFLYFLNEIETARGGLTLPWHEDAVAVVGLYAREQGALVPGRQVASAKSWLCNSSVDRTAAILPWDSDQPEWKCSPVDATTGYLLHLCDAWNYTFSKNGEDEAAAFENQEIVITVPASFDEEARELTCQAAANAGIKHLTLIEEPLAAFYAWMVANNSRLKKILTHGELILICDVGGGTTDFSLIRVLIENGEIQFVRTAIGEHLLLGGDNLDLALSHLVEARLGNPKLTLKQRKALQRQCCQAKEQLLAHPSLEKVTIRILGSGSSLIGGAMTSDVTAADVTGLLLDGYLPKVAPTDVPKRDRRVALREMGLPYASDPAITKHLAEFLTQAVDADTFESNEREPSTAPSTVRMACPDAILFNGGFFETEIAQQAIVDVLTHWFTPDRPEYKPKVLANTDLAGAVSVGAAYYAHVRREGGLRISGGSGRVYYLGVHTKTKPEPGQIPAVCVLPRGTEEGTSLEVSNLEFKVLANRPVTFTLYSSTVRHDQHGSVVTLDEADIHRHAPLVTVLSFGKRSQQAELKVKLLARYTELGTLELWCESLSTEHRWKLQFQLRATDNNVEESEETQTVISDEAIEQAIQLLKTVFRTSHSPKTDEQLTPENLVGQLEAVLGYGKDAWPVAVIRKLCDVLHELAEGRKKRASYELRWLNLYGFCLRPGFGAVLDDWRIKQARKIFLSGLTFGNDIQCQVEWFVFLARIAGGLAQGQQLDVYQRCMPLLGVGGKKLKKRLHPQVERDGWRLLANLEHLAPTIKTRLGSELIEKIQEKPLNKSFLWSLGRFGARIPLYGQLNNVVSARVASEWITTLLELPEKSWDTASALSQLGARTDDPLRDISDELRERIIQTIQPIERTGPLIEALKQYLPPESAQKVQMFGESLPIGLRMDAETI